MTDLQFRIAILGVNAAIFMALITIAVAITMPTPTVKTLYTIPAPALVYEPPGYVYPSDEGPSINEGCIASDCCAH